MDLSLVDVDPCSLIPESDYPEFHLTGPGQPRQEDDGSPQCLWTGTDAGYLGLTLDSESIEVWLDGSRAGDGEETDPILSFPAVEIADPGDSVTCFVAVDVSDSAHLLIQVGLNESPPADVPPACDYAHQFATSAMSTLADS